MKNNKKIVVTSSLLALVGMLTLGSLTVPAASAEEVLDGTLTLTNTGSWPGGLGRHNVHHSTYVEVADTEDLVIEYELLNATQDMQRFGLVKGLQDVTDEMENYDAYLEMVLSNGKKDVYSGFCMPGATELNTYSNRSAAVQEYMLANGSASYSSSDASYGLNYHTSGWGANLGKKQGMATTNVKYKHIYAADGHYEMWIYNADNPNGKKIMYTAPTFASSANQRTGITMPDSIKENDEKIFVNRSGYIGFWANHSTYSIEIDNFKVSVVENGNETVKINETYDYTESNGEYDINNWIYTKSGSSTWNCENLPEAPKELTKTTKIVYGTNAAGWNNADYSYGGYNKALIIYAHDANGSIKLDTSYDEGTFNENILLNGEPTDEIKFTLGAHSANGGSPLFLQYNNTASFMDATADNYAVLTIPAGTTLYNIEFAQDYNLYFYDGLWHTSPVAFATQLAIQQTFNHSDVSEGKTLVIYARGEDNKSIALNYAASEGNFASNLLLNGEPTDLFTFKSKGGHSADGATPIQLVYANDETLFEKTTASYLTLTIPEGTTFYNITFAEEVNLYFFDGEWGTAKPITDSEREYKVSENVVVETTYNHKEYGGKMALIIYSYTTEEVEGAMKEVSTKLNFAYGAGSFNSSIYLTEYANGVESDPIENKIAFVSGTHSIDGSSPIHLAYDIDDAFWTNTIDKYYILTIPAGTTLYNVKFENEVRLYFYEGKWMTKQPLTADEMEFVAVDTLRINPSFNHTLWKDMNALIFHGYMADDKHSAIVPNKAYPMGDFISKIALYDKAGNKVDMEFVLGTTLGHMTETSSAIHLAYEINEDFWVKTLDTYYELRIEAGAKLYNLEMTKTFSYYFYNGAWMETKPVVDYVVELDNLPTYTIGEVVEAKPGKFDKFVLGELGGENVVAGSFSSPLLTAKEYNLNFGMKVLSDEYNMSIALNGAVSNLWGGLTLTFQRVKDGSSYEQGVHYLDYLNVNGSFLGSGGDYFITNYAFEPGVEYDVTITIALDKNGQGVLMMLTVDGVEWGRLFVPSTGDYTMEEVMGPGFLLTVNNGDGRYFGEVEFTNKDANAPTLQVKDMQIESGCVADGYAYDVVVSDGIDGQLTYTATIISGELADGKFVAGLTYVVRFTAQDKVGNVMTEDVTFTCLYDVSAPEITYSANVVDGTIRVGLGLTQEELKAMIAAVATDNKDGELTVTYAFPDGMFDANGKLTEGNFRVTIRAVDSSNNEVSAIVRVRAMEGGSNTTDSNNTNNGDNAQSSSSSKKGCGSVTALGSSFAIMAVAGMIFLKKKED